MSDQLISRITVQTSLQSGLSVVYSELLDFAGSEIYFTHDPSLIGRTFHDAQFAFADSIAIGLARDGAIHLNPPPHTVMSDADELIVIADDDDAIHLGQPGAPDLGALSSPTEVTRRPEATLILGANSGLPTLLAELDQYAVPGSRVTVVADSAPKLESLPRLNVDVVAADPASRSVLDRLNVRDYDHIIVLAAKERLSAERADAKTLIVLLHLRDIAERTGVSLNIVSEMIVDRNRELAEITQADDFIVSDHLTSRVMSQVSEDARLADVLDELFSPRGAEIYLRPVELYVTTEHDVDFYTVIEAASRRGETAIGYRLYADVRNSRRGYGIVINPTKTERRRFLPGDRIIVLAEG